VSYALNDQLFNTNVATYTSTSELIVFAPKKLNESGGGSMFDGTTATNPSITPGQGYGPQAGGKQITALFGDSHAVTLSMADFRDTKSTKGRARWFPIH
jgi:hypothetical protein